MLFFLYNNNNKCDFDVVCDVIEILILPHKMWRDKISATISGVINKVT